MQAHSQLAVSTTSIYICECNTNIAFLRRKDTFYTVFPCNFSLLYCNVWRKKSSKVPRQKQENEEDHAQFAKTTLSHGHGYHWVEAVRAM